MSTIAKLATRRGAVGVGGGARGGQQTTAALNAKSGPSCCVACLSPSSMMPSEHRISDLISLKRDGDVLSKDQIEFFIQNVVSKGEISEAQMGAMLMAIYLKGMTREEAVYLTKAMLASGETIDWPEEWQACIADKHSTGGVGDKVSLVLAPALAVCGLKIPMISCRSLGHTGTCTTWCATWHFE